MSMYLHTPALEAGSWWRVDTASGSDTATTVYAHDGTDPIPTSLGTSGSTVRNTRADGTAQFWSSTATLYCKELTYQGAVTATVVTSFGYLPSAPGPTAPVDIATISATVAALPTTYASKAGSNAFTGTQDFTGATVTGIAAAADKLGLAPTAVKTSAYAASAGDLVPVDTTGGAVTVTFPTAPADGTVIAVKHVIQGGTNTVTVALGGGDKFNTSTGSTTRTLALVSQALLAQYKASTAVWYVVADDLPLSGLDARYLQVSNNLSDVTAATARTSLGLGSLATLSTITTSQITDGTITTADVSTSSFDARYAVLTENVNTVATSGATQTIPDVTSATVNRITLTAACTLTFPTAAAGKSFLLVLVQGGSGSYTITWPGTVKWASATAPTLSTTVGKVDAFSFVCADGTNWLGFTAGLDLR